MTHPQNERPVALPADEQERKKLATMEMMKMHVEAFQNVKQIVESATIQNDEKLDMVSAVVAISTVHEAAILNLFQVDTLCTCGHCNPHSAKSTNQTDTPDASDNSAR